MSPSLATRLTREVCSNGMRPRTSTKPARNKKGLTLPPSMGSAGTGATAGGEADDSGGSSGGGGGGEGADLSEVG